MVCKRYAAVWYLVKYHINMTTTETWYFLGRERERERGRGAAPMYVSITWAGLQSIEKGKKMFTSKIYKWTDD